MQINPLHNILLKASAIALALLLWIHVATNKTYEYQFDLPLKIVNIPHGLIMVSELPSEVSIKIKATGKHLLVMATEMPEIVIDAAQFKSGAVEKTITNTEILAALDRPPEDIEVVFPRIFVIRLERESQRKLPVRSAVIVEAASGYAVVSAPQIAPETVTVAGPASILHQLKCIETEPRQIGGLMTSVTQKVRLSLPDSQHLSVSDSGVIVNVTVEVQRQKTFSNLAVTPPTSLDMSRYNIIPSHLTLVLGIPQSRSDRFTASDIVITFKRPPLLRDSVRVAIQYQLPNYVEIIGAHADSVLIVRKQ